MINQINPFNAFKTKISPKANDRLTLTIDYNDERITLFLIFSRYMYKNQYEIDFKLLLFHSFISLLHFNRIFNIWRTKIKFKKYFFTKIKIINKKAPNNPGKLLNAEKNTKKVV
jgi:hypothetical protein